MGALGLGLLGVALAASQLAPSIVASALALAAEGLDRLSRGEVAEAVVLLERAHAMAPGQGAIAHDLALAVAQEGRLARALELAERAIALGEVDPDLLQLRAMLLDGVGRRSEAIAAAAEADTWEASLIGAALGDPAAAGAVSELASEETPRGALAALVLAANAGARGDRTPARTLADTAETTAQRTGSRPVAAAAHDLGQRLGPRAGWLSAGARLRTAIEHATNALYLPDGDSTLPLGRSARGFRWSVLGEGAAQAAIGTARVDGAIRADQQLYLNQRDQLDQVDLTAFSAALGVELPISERPDPVIVGFALRFRDVFGDMFRIHYASAFEGGPTLTIPFGLAMQLHLGIYGSSVDFIDLSPPDDHVSSQNRDRVGQRAVAALAFRTELLEGRAEAMLVRDDATGDAFDSRGGVLAGRLRSTIAGGFVLSTGFAVTARQFGPVGEEAILGAASKRSEVRLVAELGVRVPIRDRLAFFLEDVWIRNTGREGHEYTQNVMSLGAEASW